MRIKIREKTLNKQFTSYYRDLLQAIANGNYEVIEQLCEEELTVELAAKIYEFEKYRGVQFRILN